MLRKLRSHQSGFTLVELAIVVGIAGLLFGGLWRLLASGGAQLREQAAADQINLLISATRNFLASQEGQNLLTGLAANGVQELTLPASAADAAGQATCAGILNAALANTGTYCDFLPAGFFIGAGGTQNSFGQSYRVFIRKDNQVAGAAAQTYNFVVLTTGGDVIPDSSGGRLAGNIGANGGFVYSNDTCGAPAANFACGAFGSFTLNLTAVTSPTGGFTPGAGRIVTQTTSAESSATNSFWLSRVTIPGDTTAFYNTMRVPLNMLTGGTTVLNMGGNDINLGGMPAPTPAVAGGTINLDQGSILGQGFIDVRNFAAAPVLPASTPLRVSATGSTAAEINGIACGNIGTPGCNPALIIGGSTNISFDLTVLGSGAFGGDLEAATFIYASDARLKQDLSPLSSALDKITQLQGYHFSWKKDGKKDIGLIAQEVQKIYPELVHENAEGTLGVQYGNLVAPLIEAVKELRQQNIDLKKKLESYEQRLRKLEK
jgi:prepilin-type N-terminal cleavage/methylation domain-containing protein